MTSQRRRGPAATAARSKRSVLTLLWLSALVIIFASVTAVLVGKWSGFSDHPACPALSVLAIGDTVSESEVDVDEFHWSNRQVPIDDDFEGIHLPAKVSPDEVKNCNTRFPECKHGSPYQCAAVEEG